MIAGEVMSFLGANDDFEISEPVLIELTDCEGDVIEICAKVGKRKIYLKFRISDLLREIKEVKALAKSEGAA